MGEIGKNPRCHAKGCLPASAHSTELTKAAQFSVQYSATQVWKDAPLSGDEALTAFGTLHALKVNAAYFGGSNRVAAIRAGNVQ